MDEAKPKAADKPPAEQSEQSGEGCASNNTAGDFTLDELMRAHNRNFDPAGRRLDRPEGDK